MGADRSFFGRGIGGEWYGKRSLFEVSCWFETEVPLVATTHYMGDVLPTTVYG